MASDAELVGLITADASGLEKAVKQSKISLLSLGDMFQSVGKIGAHAGVAIAAAAAGATTAAVAMASQFEKTMKNIQAASGKSADEIARLGPEILKIGSNSVAGPQKVAAAFYDIVGGVADASTHMAILKAAVATSEAGQADLASTTQGLISIMNSYKLSAKDAAMVSDVLTRVVGKGVGTMDQFVAAISPIAGLAAASGVSVKELGTAMAFMTTKGATASQAATQTQAAMTALLKPNAALNKLLAKVNIETTNAAGAQGKYIKTTAASAGELAKMNAELAKSQAQLSRMAAKGKKDALDNINIAEKQGKIAELQNKIANGNRVVTRTAGQATKVTAEYLLKNYGLAGSLQKLKEAAGGSTQAMAEALGSVEALRAFVTLTGGDWADFAKDFENGIDGATEAARAVQLDSFNAQWDMFKNKLESAAIAIGSLLLPPLNALFNLLNKVAPILGQLANEIGGSILRALASLGASINSLFPQLLPSLQSLKDKIGGFFATLFDAGPGEGDMTKRAAIVKNMQKMGDITAEEGQAAMDRMAAKMKETMGDKLIKALGIDPAAFAQLAADIQLALKPVGDGILNFIGSLSSTDTTIITETVKQVGQIISEIAAIAKAVGIGFLNSMAITLPLLGGAINSFVSGASALLKGDLGKAVHDLGEGFMRLGAGLANIPLNIAVEVGKLLGIDVGAGLATWKTNFEMLGTIITKLFGPDGEIGKALANIDVEKAISDAVNGAITWLKGAGKTLWDSTFGALGKSASEFLANVGDSIVKSIKKALLHVLAILFALKGKGVPGLDGLIDTLGGALGKERGGSVLKGSPYMVGEGGPELFVPNSGGRVLPNGAGGGGGMKIQNVYVYGVQNPDQMLAQLEKAAKRRNRNLTVGA